MPRFTIRVPLKDNDATFHILTLAAVQLFRSALLAIQWLHLGQADRPEARIKSSNQVALHRILSLDTL